MAEQKEVEVKTEKTEKTEHVLTERERATLRILGQLQQSAKARVFDAQARLEAAQAEVDRTQREVARLQDRIDGSISTLIDTNGLEGQWRLDEALAKFVKVQ